VGIETVLHYTCRDRNVLSIQSDLLGASSIGLKNILCLTGDPPKLGNYPDATAVFDVDAIGLVNIVHNLNYGLDIGKNSIGESTGFTKAVQVLLTEHAEGRSACRHLMTHSSQRSSSGLIQLEALYLIAA